MFKIYVEPESPNERGVFKIYVEPEPPVANEGAVFYVLNRNRQMMGRV